MKADEIAKKLLKENRWETRPERPSYVRMGHHVVVGPGIELKEDFVSTHSSVERPSVTTFPKK